MLKVRPVDPSPSSITPTGELPSDWLKESAGTGVPSYQTSTRPVAWLRWTWSSCQAPFVTVIVLAVVIAVVLLYVASLPALVTFTTSMSPLEAVRKRIRYAIVLLLAMLKRIR